MAMLGFLVISGCGPRMHEVRVVPSVADATVVFDGETLGKGETVVAVPRHDRQARSLEICGPEGWFCTTTTLDARTPEVLEVEVPRDDAWHATEPVEDANGWVEVGAGTAAQMDATWQQAADIVRATHPELEVDDPQSFYLRTPWIVAGESGDPSRIRSRLIMALGDATRAEALSFKLRIESERIDERGLPQSLSKRAIPEIVDARDAVVASLDPDAGPAESGSNGSAEKAAETAPSEEGADEVSP